MKKRHPSSAQPPQLQILHASWAFLIKRSTPSGLAGPIRMCGEQFTQTWNCALAKGAAAAFTGVKAIWKRVYPIAALISLKRLIQGLPQCVLLLSRNDFPTHA